MTDKEHLLVVSLLTRQAQFTKVLINILKSKGIMEGDDAAAYQQVTAQDQQSNAAIFYDTAMEYLKVAKGLGIQTGLEKLIPPLNPPK